MGGRGTAWRWPRSRDGRAWSPVGAVWVLFWASFVPGASPAARAQGTITKEAPALSDEALAQVIRGRALWENNTLGITDKIPPPWTAMTVRGRTVACWGRSYEYEASLLPRQVTSQDAEMLAAPIALVVRVGGREIQFLQATDQKLSAAPNRVDIDATATAKGLRIQARSHIEYDGCARVELDVSPADRPVLIEGLELQMPLWAERVLYYHWFEATRDPKLTNAGALPKTGLRSHFKPLLWLGDDDRGFCWFSESPKDWQISDKESVLEVRREGQATVMCVRMMDRPHVVARPWRTVFGLMATPVRPMPAGWRDWLIPLNITNPWGAWYTGFFNNVGGTDDPGTLYPLDPQAMKRSVAQWQRRGQRVPLLPIREPMRVMPYSQVVFWAGKHRDGTPSPEIKVFGPEWSNRNQPPGPRREADADIPINEYYWVCPASSFAQFYIYRFNQLLDETGIDGIYIDGPWNTCSNALHGCGWRDDEGNWQPEFKIWAFRELLKRIYCLLYEKRENPIVCHHTSCWLAIPCLSFSHMMLDGEQYHDPGQKVEAHFLDVVPLDKWRAEHTGRQWGPAPFLLPDIPPQYCADEAATRELLMLTNLHDTGLFPAGNNMRAVMRNYQARRLFGVAECEFRGYWAAEPWVRCETPECYVSVYRKPERSRVLLVIGNTALTEATATVRPNLEALGLPANTDAGVDIETGEQVPLANGVLKVTVRGRDFRLIALPYYEPPPVTAGDYTAMAVEQVPNAGFEEGLDGWQVVAVEGNRGTIEADATERHSGAYSCHLHKAEGPGGVMVQTEDVLRAGAGGRYRVNCWVKIANATGAKAYWMISMMDAQGRSTAENNLFHGFLTENQDWKELPYEFELPPGTVVIRLHFLVAFEGTADVWIDDVTFEKLE